MPVERDGATRWETRVQDMTIGSGGSFLAGSHCRPSRGAWVIRWC